MIIRHQKDGQYL